MSSAVGTPSSAPEPRPTGADPSPTAGPAATATPKSSPTANATAATSPFVGAWTDVTADAIGPTADWTNKVELADINADGNVDILLANGGDYERPGQPVASRVFVNNGDGTFQEKSDEILGDFTGLTRVIKAVDLDADGNLDLVVGTTFSTQSRLFMGADDGTFTDVTETNLPAAALSVGDLEAGDVDADGDLDLVLADWGDGNPFEVSAPVVLWLNDGSAVFSLAPDGSMPETPVGFSWDIELVDIDNDWDLDAAVSCKACPRNLLFENEGSGSFTDVSEARMPAFPNNYEFAPIDLDGDGFLDLVTINTGPRTALGFPEHVLRNDGTGTYVDMTAEWWPPEANPGFDDNLVVGVDIESDGDSDFMIASLDGPDRLLINDGTGRLTMIEDILAGSPGMGTLAIALADLNGDNRPDVVEAQGEVPGHEDERVYFATDAVPVDTAPPIVTTDLPDAPAGEVTVHARVHDNRTPNMPHDWQTVELRWSGASSPLTWYGENLFRVTVELPADAGTVQVCAVDVAGNEACAD